MIDDFEKMKKEMYDTYSEVRKLLKDVEVPGSPLWYRVDEATLKPNGDLKRPDDVAIRLDNLLGKIYTLFTKAHMKIMTYAMRHAGEQIVATLTLDVLNGIDAIREIRKRITDEGKIIQLSEVYDYLITLRSAIDGVVGRVEEILYVASKEES